MVDDRRVADESSDPSGDIWEGGLAAAFRDEESSETASHPTRPHRKYSDDTARVGTRLGRYEVRSLVGRGGLGTVYKGWDSLLGRDVAIKIVRDQFRRHAQTRTRLDREARIGSRLQHPNIVPVYDLGLDDDTPYIVMRLVEGRTLSSLLAQRTSPAADLHRFTIVFEHVAQALAYAHAHDVIHRDLKPTNVMVDVFDEVQVMDWGLAKVVADKDTEPPHDDTASAPAGRDLHGVSEEGMVVGTPSYMAPEQARGDTSLVGKATDVFGLGAILCEILTGFPPFVGATSEVARGKAAAGDLADARARLAVCAADPELVHIALVCMAPDAPSRPKDAAAVARDVGRHLAGMDERLRRAEVAAAEAGARAMEERRIRRLIVALTAVVCFVLASAGATAWWIDRASRDRERLATRSLARASEEARAAFQRAGGSAEEEMGSWDQALTLARAAAAVAEGHRVDPETRVRALEFLDTVEVAHRDAAGRAETYRRNRLFAERMERARELVGQAARQNLAHAAAFAERGFDADAMTERDLDSARASPWALELARALDHWASTLRALGDIVRRDDRLRLAMAIDGDPQRTLLRTALLEGQRIPSLDPDVARTLPAETLELWADALSMTGREGEATDVLGLGELVHPDRFWIRFSRAALLGPGPDKRASLQAAVALRPGSHGAWNNLGVALHDAGETDLAVMAYGRALSLEPTEGAIWHNLGSTLMTAETVPLGLASLQRAVELAPWRPETILLLKESLLQVGARNEARRVLLEGLQVLPEAAVLHDAMGRLLRQGGDLAGAIPFYREALRHDPHLTWAHNDLGSLLWARGDLDAALASYRSAVDASATESLPSANLAHALATNARPQDALEVIDACLARGVHDVKLFEVRARLLLQVGDFPGVETAAREAISIDGSHAVAHVQLALACQGQGRLEEAVAMMRRGHELGCAARWTQPSAQWLADLEHAARLTAEVERTVRSGPPDLAPAELVDLARILLHRGLFRSAAGVAKTALERGQDTNLPPDVRLLGVRAAAMALLEEHQEARQKASLRSRIIKWMDEELRVRAALVAAHPERAQETALALDLWLRHPELSTLRVQPAGAAWTEDQSRSLEELWSRFMASARSLRGSGGR